jgi:hypothetical protein
MSKATDIDENIANQNHATRTRTPKPGYLNLSIVTWMLVVTWNLRNENARDFWPCIRSLYVASQVNSSQMSLSAVTKSTGKSQVILHTIQFFLPGTGESPMTIIDQGPQKWGSWWLQPPPPSIISTDTEHVCPFVLGSGNWTNSCMLNFQEIYQPIIMHFKLTKLLWEIAGNTLSGLV